MRAEWAASEQESDIVCKVYHSISFIAAAAAVAHSIPSVCLSERNTYASAHTQMR